MKKIGIISTIVYLIFISWLIGDRFTQLNTMKLNEIGDFCAGVFGPITFFWLILGFIMQSEELKQSSEALKLQASELKNSVEQQKEMVKVTTLQFERELEKEHLREKAMIQSSQPIFDFVKAESFSNSSGKVTYGFTLRNSGHSVTNVKVSLPTDYELAQNSHKIWDDSVSISFNLSFMNTNTPRNINIEFSFTDGQRINRTSNYMLQIDGTGTNKLLWSKNGYQDI